MPPLPAPTNGAQEAAHQHLLKGAHEAAFTAALNAQDVSAVLFACRWCSASTARSGGDITAIAKQLSPMLQLCLLQQVGLDLASDTALKLEWLGATGSALATGLRGASSSGQPGDWAVIKQYLPGIVATLEQQVSAVPAAADRGSRILRELRAVS